MEKSFEIRHPRVSEYESLKALWQTAFDDKKESLDFFFRNTVSPERVLAAFDAGEPVSVLYMLESEIEENEKTHSAYYIYAVCTHPKYRGMGLMKSLFNKLFMVAADRGVDYLFLVPEQEYLFGVYEKLGFKNGFYYSEKEVYKSDYEKLSSKNGELTYEDYRKCVSVHKKNVPVATLCESTFNSFFNSQSGEVKTVFCENEGYALFEETENGIVIFELFGNEKLLLSKIFGATEKQSAILRCVSDENPVPYGMYYILNGAPEIRNGFFGLPYSN